jgi:hypothetical protein
MFNKRGLFSFDFILALVVFIFSLNYILAFTNDMDAGNKEIIENIQNYDAYLQINEAVQSTNSLEDFSGTITVKGYFDNCNLSTDNGALKINGETSEFFVQNYSGLDLQGECVTSIKFLQ